MVSMTQSGATLEELHNRAHAAALAARDEHNWWNGSLETGVAAAAGALHPPGTMRRIGEVALDGLRRWVDADDARPIGEDAAALALGAFAAHRMGQPTKKLCEAAVSTIKQVLSSSRAPLAPLHLTLAVWALRELVSVDDQSPWPELRERLPQLPTLGVDSMVVAYGRILATPAPDPLELSRVLQNVPDVEPADYGILLWTLWSGSVLLTRLVEDESDADLAVVRKRRTEIFNTIAAETHGESSPIAGVDDFDPFPDDEESAYAELPPDPFDVLMIDLALSAEIKGESLLTPTEAEIVVAKRSKTPVLFWAGTLELLAGAAAAITALVALLLDARFGILFGSAAIAFSLFSFGALRVWYRVEVSRWPRRSLLDANAALFVLGVAIVVTWAPDKPLVTSSEFVTVVVGLGAPVAFALLLALLRPLIEGRR